METQSTLTSMSQLTQVLIAMLILIAIAHIHHIPLTEATVPTEAIATALAMSEDSTMNMATEIIALMASKWKQAMQVAMRVAMVAMAVSTVLMVTDKLHQLSVMAL